MASDPAFALPPSWPAMSLAEAQALLTAPGQPFEMTTATIRGVETRVWKNAPPSLRALIDASRAHRVRLMTIYEDERVSYDANHRATAALAAHLSNLGVGRGDRVALAMRNLPEWPVAFFAIVSLGAIAVPLNAWWTGEELAYGLRDSGARVLIADGERHQRLGEHYHSLPELEHALVSRATTSLDDNATRLEAVIGTPHDWARLPFAELPEAASRMTGPRCSIPAAPLAPPRERC